MTCTTFYPSKVVQGHQTPAMVGNDEVLPMGIDFKGGADSL
jgi:hypothetical protein